jgi:hypothetical protein
LGESPTSITACTPATGLPAESDFAHCEDSIPGGTSCYFLNNTYLTFLQAQKACKRNTGAYLVAWNSADEQLRIEQYFNVGAGGGLGPMAQQGPFVWACWPVALTAALGIAGDGPTALDLLDGLDPAEQPVLLA